MKYNDYYGSYEKSYEEEEVRYLRDVHILAQQICEIAQNTATFLIVLLKLLWNLLIIFDDWVTNQITRISKFVEIHDEQICEVETLL